MGMWIVLLLIAIVYGMEAGRGEWAECPSLGRLSRKIPQNGARRKLLFSVKAPYIPRHPDLAVNTSSPANVYEFVRFCVHGLDARR
jgi:hypothetical protein